MNHSTKISDYYEYARERLTALNNAPTAQIKENNFEYRYIPHSVTQQYIMA